MWWMCLCVAIHVEARGWHQMLPQSVTLSLVSETGSLITPSSLMQAVDGQWAPGRSLLAFPVLGSQAYTAIFDILCSIWIPELRSSWLCGKYFTCWAISQVTNGNYFILVEIPSFFFLPKIVPIIWIILAEIPSIFSFFLPNSDNSL